MNEKWKNLWRLFAALICGFGYWRDISHAQTTAAFLGAFFCGWFVARFLDIAVGNERGSEETR